MGTQKNIVSDTRGPPDRLWLPGELQRPQSARWQEKTQRNEQADPMVLLHPPIPCSMNATGSQRAGKPTKAARDSPPLQDRGKLRRVEDGSGEANREEPTPTESLWVLISEPPPSHTTALLAQREKERAKTQYLTESQGVQERSTYIHFHFFLSTYESPLHICSALHPQPHGRGLTAGNAQEEDLQEKPSNCDRRVSK